MKDIAIAWVPDAGRILLRTGDGRVTIIDVEDSIDRGLEHRNSYPGDERTGCAVVAFDLVRERAGGGPAARGCVFGSEEDVVTESTRDAARGCGSQIEVDHADEDGKVVEIG